MGRVDGNHSGGQECLGAAAQDKARRTDERVLGSAAARQSGPPTLKRCVSGGGTRASPPSHGHDHRRCADRSRREGAVPRVCFGNGPEIWRLAKRHQDFADRLGDEGSNGGRGHHIEEPHADAGSAALHRLRARGRKADGDIPTPTASKNANLSHTRLSGGPLQMPRLNATIATTNPAPDTGSPAMAGQTQSRWCNIWRLSSSPFRFHDGRGQTVRTS
jgi:hypothetical protein